MQNKNTSPLRAKYEMVLLDENGEVIKDRSAERSSVQKEVWKKKKRWIAKKIKIQEWKYKPTKE